MQLIEVKSREEEREFIRVNVVLQQGLPDYIMPLEKDIDEVFDPARNKTFRFGKVNRWILRDEDGSLLGRIAAFTNRKYRNKGDEIAVGGIGFFECIHNQDAADMLFDVARH